MSFVQGFRVVNQALMSHFARVPASLQVVVLDTSRLRVGIMSTPDAARCCGESNGLNPDRGETASVVGRFRVPLVLPSRSPSGITKCIQ
jgi:hypothetical protein